MYSHMFLGTQCIRVMNNFSSCSLL